MRTDREAISDLYKPSTGLGRIPLMSHTLSMSHMGPQRSLWEGALLRRQGGRELGLSCHSCYTARLHSVQESAMLMKALDLVGDGVGVFA